jgi:CheY-like chemotaxis protein
MSALRPIEVLLIEDNACDVRLAKHVLSEYREPVALHFAANGEQALAMLSQAGIDLDLIILDLSVPGIAGEELGKRWASIDIPRVIFSSSANPREIRRLLADGASDYVQKPTDLDTFTRAMFQILDRWTPGPKVGHRVK